MTSEVPAIRLVVPEAASPPPARPTRASLLDRADLGALRSAAARLDGPFATVAACLVAGGALAHDPAEPDWPDRDRVVAGDEAAAAGHPHTLGSRRGAQGVDVVAGWEALPRAVGLAAASRLDGGIFGIWGLLGLDAVDHGGTWEAARTAAAARIDTLVAVVAAPDAACREAARIFAAAGWRVAEARASDAAEVLGALDHALAAGSPALVAAVVR